MNRFQREKEQLVRAARMLFERGLVKGIDGVMVWRVGSEEVLATPVNTCLGHIETSDVALLSLADEKGVDSLDASTSLLMKILDREKDLRSLIHGHPKFCSILGLLQESPPLMMMPGFANRMGSLRMVRYDPHWEKEVLQALEGTRQSKGGLLIEHLGVVAFGENPISAALALESIEHYMEIFYHGRFDEINHRRVSETQHVEHHLNKLYLELTTRCDLSCPKCLRRTGKVPEDKEMDLEQVGNIIRQVEEIGTCKEVVLFGYGEVLCHDHALEIIGLLKSYSVKLTLITNGMYLNEESVVERLVKAGLDKLYISFDGPHHFSLQEREEKENLHHRCVQDALQKLIRIKEVLKCSHPEVGILTVITKSNLRRIREILNMVEEIKASDILISNLLPYDKDLSRISLINRSGGQVFRNKYNTQAIDVARMDYYGPRCCKFIAEGAAFVSVEGDMSPCPTVSRSHVEHILGADKRINQLKFGNVFDSGMNEIWHSGAYQEFRDKFMYFDFPDCFTCSIAELCNNRTEGEHDCFESETPCSDCLWSKGLILCP